MTLLAVLSLLALSIMASPSAPASMTTAGHGAWPMFHQNAQHTGLSPFRGPSAPVLEWTFKTGGPIDSSPAIGHGRIYITSEDGNLYVLNLHGHLLWTFQTRHPIKTTPAIGLDGTIYLATCNRCGNDSVSPEGILYALSPGGQLKWNLTIPNTGEGIDSLTSPTIGLDGTIYVSDVDFRVLAVNPNGTLRWEVATDGEVVGSPAVAPDGTVFVEVDDPGPPVGLCQVLNKCILALNSDGSVKWALQNFGEFDSPAIGPDGTVYVSGEAVSSNGTLEWENRPFSSPSIGADGTIYGTAEGGLYAVNRDGSVRWQFPTVRDSGSSNPCCSYVSVQQSSVAIGSSGIEYFGVGVTHFCSCGPSPSSYGNASLYAVSPNGALVWKFAITTASACASLGCASASISDPAIGPHGTIYIGSGDGNLYAIA